MKLDDLVAHLDAYLRIREVPDDPGAANGLQVANRGDVRKLVACTDACQATIDAAVDRGADLVLVHHGMLWEPHARVTGRHYRRLRALLEHDVALYCAHIPLDVHPEVGNNVQLAGALGVESRGWFGDYRGIPIGVWGELSVTRDELAERLARVLGREPKLIPGGPSRTARVGVITGGAGSMIAQARDAGLDAFVTGEGMHYTFFDAEEWGLNVFFAGHYATETLGVKALARHLEQKFGLPWEFVDHPTGL